MRPRALVGPEFGVLGLYRGPVSQALGRERMDWKTWRRPTLPRLETQYHGRWGFSRPSSGWDRVRAPRRSHQVVQPTRGYSPRGMVAGSGVPQAGFGLRWCVTKC